MKVKIRDVVFEVNYSFSTAILNNKGKVRGWQKGVCQQAIAVVDPAMNAYGVSVIMRPIRTEATIRVSGSDIVLAKGRAIRTSFEVKPFEKVTGVKLALTDALKNLGPITKHVEPMLDRSVRTAFWNKFNEQRLRKFEKQDNGVVELMDGLNKLFPPQTPEAQESKSNGSHATSDPITITVG